MDNQVYESMDLFIDSSEIRDRLETNVTLPRDTLEEEIVELNGWRAPDFRYTNLLREIKFRINAPKNAAIEQSLLYIDSASADDWIYLSSREDYDYTSKFNSLPMDIMAKLVVHHLENSAFEKDKINFFSLGPGDGKQEERFIRCVRSELAPCSIKCQLMDISPPLALESHARLTDAFSDLKEVQVSWLVGNFLFLPHYSEIFDEDDQNVLRVVSMFGGTFGNLQSELHFLRHSLQVLKSGDLFLLDVVLTFAPISDVNAIHMNDPRLDGAWKIHTDTWLRGPIERYRKNVQSIRFENHLKVGTSPFANSYTIEVQAIINEQSQLTMMQLHRYDMQGFIDTFAREGWIPLGGQTYGMNNKRLAYLFAKK